MTVPVKSFDPATADPREFRAALGRFATGITIVTCMTPTGPLGITANSFSSLSLDPPLVLWSPAKASSRYPHFHAATHYAIHVLGDDQQDLCQAFASSGDAFDGLDWSQSPTGAPLIAGCLARFECRQVAVHDGGDHAIIVGQVARASTRDGAPLLFSGGRFCRLGD